MPSLDTPQENELTEESVRSWMFVFDEMRKALGEAEQTGKMRPDIELKIYGFLVGNPSLRNVPLELSNSFKTTIIAVIEKLRGLNFDPEATNKLEGLFGESANRIGEEAREKVESNFADQQSRALEQTSASGWIKQFDEQIIPLLTGTKEAKELSERAMEPLHRFLSQLPDVKKLTPELIKELEKTTGIIDAHLKRLGYSLFDEEQEFTTRGQLDVFTQRLKSAEQEILISKLDNHSKNQFNRAESGLRKSKKNIEALDPNLPEDELDSKIQQFAEQFSEMLIFLTYECLERSLTDPEVVKYFKNLAREIISHPNFDLVKNSPWHQVYFEGEFVKFIK